MLDGVKLFISSINFPAFKEATGIPFEAPVDTDTGSIGRIRSGEDREVRTIRYRGCFQTYRLTVVETCVISGKGSGNTTCHLEIEGSFHKNHFAGQNSQPFTWDQLQAEIVSLCNGLKLDPSKTNIQNLEFGVNVPVNFSPIEFLDDHLLGYRGTNRFMPYDEDQEGKSIGYQCKMNEYRVKVYDKGYQYDLFPAGQDQEQGLLRFELRHTKMRKLNDRGIKTLADLQTRDKVYNLKKLLLPSWKHVLILHPAISEAKDIPPRHMDFYRKATRSGFWKTASHEDRKKYRHLVIETLAKKGEQDLHENLFNLIAKQWENLFRISEKSPGGRTQSERADFRKITVKVKGDISEKQFCLWCKQDISDQKPGSRFCAARYRGGKEVNRCRDKFRRAGQKWRKGLAKRQKKIEFPGEAVE